jgi:hypothetical protein
MSAPKRRGRRHRADEKQVAHQAGRVEEVDHHVGIAPTTIRSPTKPDKPKKPTIKSSEST